MSSAELQVLDRMIEQSRARLRASADRVGGELERATDLSPRIRRRPLAGLGIAAGTGVVAGLLAGRVLRGGAGSARSGLRFAGRQALVAARLLLIKSLVQEADS